MGIFDSEELWDICSCLHIFTIKFAKGGAFWQLESNGASHLWGILYIREICLVGPSSGKFLEKFSMKYYNLDQFLGRAPNLNP